MKASLTCSGCAVIPCCAHSPASYQKIVNHKRIGLLPEKMRGCAGNDRCGHSNAEAAITMAEIKIRTGGGAPLYPSTF